MAMRGIQHRLCLGCWAAAFDDVDITELLLHLLLRDAVLGAVSEESAHLGTVGQVSAGAVFLEPHLRIVRGSQAVAHYPPPLLLVVPPGDGEPPVGEAAFQVERQILLVFAGDHTTGQLTRWAFAQPLGLVTCEDGVDDQPSALDEPDEGAGFLEDSSFVGNDGLCDDRRPPDLVVEKFGICFGVGVGLLLVILTASDS